LEGGCEGGGGRLFLFVVNAEGGHKIDVERTQTIKSKKRAGAKAV